VTISWGRCSRAQALAVILGLVFAGQLRVAAAGPLEFEQYDDPVLYQLNFDYFGFPDSFEAQRLPRVTVVGYSAWQTICVGSNCADYMQSISEAALTAALIAQNQLTGDQQIAALTNPKKDVRCYVAVPGVSEADAQGVRNTTSQSSPEQKWIAAEAMYRWYAVTTPRVAQALNREIVNGVLAYRVTFADGGSAAYEILMVIPSPVSPALAPIPIPNSERPGSGQPENSGTCG
jgi:hypothetical protein